MQIYSLYFKKKDKKIEIGNWKGRDVSLSEGEVYQFNDCYFLSLDRKLLREKAKRIQEQWIDECKQELEDTKNIKIKTKYR